MVRNCPPGKILNPATNRCVKRDGAIGRRILATAAPAASRPASPRRPPRSGLDGLRQNLNDLNQARCPPGKIVNPATNRCVKRDGPIGRRILAAQGGSGAAAPRAASPRRPAARAAAQGDCPPGKIRNPATGRCVKRDGPTGRRILAAQGGSGAEPAVPRAASPRRASPRRTVPNIVSPIVNRPGLQEEGYDVIGSASYVTIDEFLKEAKEDNESPLVIRVNDKILLFTSESLRSLNPPGDPIPKYRLCKNVLKGHPYVRYGYNDQVYYSHLTQMQSLINKRKTYYLDNNDKNRYHRLRDLFVDPSLEGLISDKDVRELMNKSKTPRYVHLKKDSEIKHSFIAEMTTSNKVINQGCRPLKSKKYIYKLENIPSSGIIPPVIEDVINPVSDFGGYIRNILKEAEHSDRDIQRTIDLLNQHVLDFDTLLGYNDYGDSVGRFRSDLTNIGIPQNVLNTLQSYFIAV